MKPVYKIIILLAMSIVLTNCSDDNDGRFASQPEQGWIDFRTSNTQVVTNSISIPVNVNVPVFPEGLNIRYSVENVSGDFTEFINPSGTFFADPEDITRNTKLELPLIKDIETNGNSNPVVFDITLTAVDKAGIRIGIDSNSIITHRVGIECVNTDNLPSDIFVGGYSIIDINATVGPGNNTSNFAGEVGNKVSLTVDPANPNNRLFNARILPAFLPDVVPVTISFSKESVALGATVDTPLTCTGAAPFYVYSPETEVKNSTWNICDDSSIVITYIEDANASCNGPYESSFMLTKL